MYQYPYGDSQQLNLDWIINKLIELEQSFVAGETAQLEEFANALISLTYIPTQPYNHSDIVFHDGHLYRCNTIIPAPGEVWDPSHWDQIMLGNTVANLVRAVAGMDSDHVFNESNVPGTHVTEALNALVEDIRYDNHKIQQKKNGAYTDVIQVEDTPSNNSDRLASSKAAYDLKDAIAHITTTTNTLFTMYGLQIGKGASGNTASVRAISADIYCENGIVVKAEQLPLNLKYEIEYYSGANLSDFVGAVSTGWITDNNTYTSPSSVTQKHFRILFGSVDNNALTTADFEGLVLQVNNGSALDTTAKDKDAREVANDAKAIADCSEDALNNWGDALVSVTWHYDSTTVPANDGVTVTPNNLDLKLDRYYFVGINSITTGDKSLLIRGFVGYSGELNLVNISNTNKTFSGAMQVRFFDPLVLQNFFA